MDSSGVRQDAFGVHGTPGRTRTDDLNFATSALYPTELPGHTQALSQVAEARSITQNWCNLHNLLCLLVEEG